MIPKAFQIVVGVWSFSILSKGNLVPWSVQVTFSRSGYRADLCETFPMNPTINRDLNQGCMNHLGNQGRVSSRTFPSLSVTGWTDLFDLIAKHQPFQN